MFRLTVTRSIARPSQRCISTARVCLNKGPPITQGHTIGKSKDDPQASSVTSAQNEKASSGGSDDSQPFDAARQSGTSGAKKTSQSKEDSDIDQGQSGALKDQVGGQEGSARGVEYGGQEEAESASAGEALKKTLGSFDGLKKLRDENKNFHTSARQQRPQSTLATVRLPGNAKPFHSGRISKANAPAEKYAKALPADQSHETANAPPEALPPNLESTYSASATQPAPSSMKPSSKVAYSSSAVDPPHPKLSEQAKEDGLASRNSQPTAEMGRQGNSEAWKHRK